MKGFPAAGRYRNLPYPSRGRGAPIPEVLIYGQLCIAGKQDAAAIVQGGGIAAGKRLSACPEALQPQKPAISKTATAAAAIHQVFLRRNGTTSASGAGADACWAVMVARRRSQLASVLMPKEGASGRGLPASGGWRRARPRWPAGLSARLLPTRAPGLPPLRAGTCTAKNIMPRLVADGS